MRCKCHCSMNPRNRQDEDYMTASCALPVFLRKQTPSCLHLAHVIHWSPYRINILQSRAMQYYWTSIICEVDNVEDVAVPRNLYIYRHHGLWNTPFLH